VFASDPRYGGFVSAYAFPNYELNSISSKDFFAALARGRPVYDFETLRDYVHEDLRIFDEVKPDLVVGDFRLSLAVSARKARLPYVSLCNAYWSPYAARSYLLPAHPINRVLGRHVASVLFKAAAPLIFAHHAAPMRRLRREFGVSDAGIDLPRAYTDADYVAYADLPGLVPTSRLPENHSYIGPVHWSPHVPLPVWWRSFDRSLPIVYVTLGSSGDSRLLPTVVEALAGLPAMIAIATAGASLPMPLPSNAHVAEYLPGDKIAPHASLFVCNGGSLTSYQALAKGVPILGIASNLDQHLNIEAIARRGAGIRLPADRLSIPQLRDTVNRLLSVESYRNAACEIAREFADFDPPKRLAAILGAVT
jgi:UDP:flavonoid glycosyltransferase YjiC (YdhE family)